jgi:hypothetical protein
MASNHFLSRTVIQSINVLQTRRPSTHLGVSQNLQPWKPKFLDVFDVYICLSVDLDHHIFKYPIWTLSMQFSDSQWWAMPTCLSTVILRELVWRHTEICLDNPRLYSGITRPAHLTFLWMSWRNCLALTCSTAANARVKQPMKHFISFNIASFPAEIIKHIEHTHTYI